MLPPGTPTRHVRGPRGPESGALKSLPLFHALPTASPLLARLPLQASSAGVAIVAFSLTLPSPHPSSFQ